MVSIIVPVYNVKDYLEKCVNSILCQTLKEIEILLVDDGSTDGSDKICDSYATLDKRVNVIHKKNGGSTSARNAGLQVAKGEYIGFVDSDDWIEPEMYEVLLTRIEIDQSDVVISKKCYNHPKSEYTESISIPDGVYEKGNKTLLKNLIYSEDFCTRGITPNLCDKLFKKSILLKYQLQVDPRIKYGEDDVCVYSCLINADKITIVNQAFYHYRIREGSICHSTDDRYFERITYFYNELKKNFLKHSEASILLPQLNKYMLEFVLRGINKQFGFGFGTVIPFYIPPYPLLEKYHVKTLILYGAGNVGQDYYKSFQMTGIYTIVAWVDKQYKDYAKGGLPVESVVSIQSKLYDAILIAVEHEDLAVQIKNSLVNLGVREKIVLYQQPQSMVQILK